MLASRIEAVKRKLCQRQGTAFGADLQAKVLRAAARAQAQVEVPAEQRNPARQQRRIAAVGQPNAIINPRTQIGLQPVNARVRVPRHFRHLDIDASKRGFHLFLSGRIQLERITNVSA